jgi:pimeloyl-ACP methyl ester carboxylesterase
MQKLILLAGLVLGVSLSPFGSAFGDDDPSLKTDCVWETNFAPFGYCVTRTIGSTNPDVVIYMHGAGGWQNAWPAEMHAIIQYWKDNGIQAPTIVTASFGPIFLLAQKNGSHASGLLHFFADGYMDKIEAAVGGFTGRRILVGQSMGGFNAVQLAMKRPEKFVKIAIVCPDITTLSPYSTLEEVQSFMDSTGADFSHSWWEMLMDRIFFANDGSWNDAAPLLAGSKYLGPQTPPMYISGGWNDQFGFYQGTEQFIDIAKKAGADVQWVPVPGKHCSFDAGGVARFITE